MSAFLESEHNILCFIVKQPKNSLLCSLLLLKAMLKAEVDIILVAVIKRNFIIYN